MQNQKKRERHSDREKKLPDLLVLFKKQEALLPEVVWCMLLTKLKRKPLAFLPLFCFEPQPLTLSTRHVKS